MSTWDSYDYHSHDFRHRLRPILHLIHRKPLHQQLLRTLLLPLVDLEHIKHPDATTTALGILTTIIPMTSGYFRHWLRPLHHLIHRKPLHQQLLRTLLMPLVDLRPTTYYSLRPTTYHLRPTTTTQPLSHSATQLLSHSVTQPLSRLAMQSVTQPLSHSAIHPLSHSLTQSLDSATQPFTQRPSTYDLPPTTCDLRPTACDLRPATYDLQPTTVLWK